MHGLMCLQNKQSDKQTNTKRLQLADIYQTTMIIQDKILKMMSRIIQHASTYYRCYHVLNNLVFRKQTRVLLFIHTDPEVHIVSQTK